MGMKKPIAALTMLAGLCRGSAAMALMRLATVRSNRSGTSKLRQPRLLAMLTLPSAQ